MLYRCASTAAAGDSEASISPPSVDVDTHQKDEDDDEEGSSVEPDGDPVVVLRRRRVQGVVVLKDGRQHDGDDQDDEGAGKEADLRKKVTFNSRKRLDLTGSENAPHKRPLVQILPVAGFFSIHPLNCFSLNSALIDFLNKKMNASAEGGKTSLTLKK